MDLNTKVCMKNKYLLITLFDTQKKLGNNINMKEVRGKRDIVIGVVEAAEASLKLPLKAMCWFPLYAGSEVEYDGKKYLTVPYEDIIMIERVE